MPERTPREDSVIVATNARRHLANALDGLDVILEDEDGSVEMSERRAVRSAVAHVLRAIRDLNEGAAELSGLSEVPVHVDKVRR